MELEPVETKKKKKKKTKKQKKEETKNNKIIQLLTVASELVTLDCSLTHVLNSALPQLRFAWAGLFLRSSLLIDKTVVDQTPLLCFSKSKDDYREMPEN